MNKKFFSLLAGAAMVVAGLTFASCGNDDDDNSSKGGGATTVYATPVVMVSEDILANFDATCTIDGVTVTLTKDNTVACDTTSSGGKTFNMRKYTGATKTYTQFPALTTLAERVKLKDGKNYKELGKIDYAVYAKMVYANNSSSGELTRKGSDKGGLFSKQFDTAKATADLEKKHTDLTFQINDTLTSATTYSTGFDYIYSNLK